MDAPRIIGMEAEVTAVVAEQLVAKLYVFFPKVAPEDVLRWRTVCHKLSDSLSKTTSHVQEALTFSEALQKLWLFFCLLHRHIQEVELANALIWKDLPSLAAYLDDMIDNIFSWDNVVTLKQMACIGR
ncbi:hypothetical protein PMIN01_06381 [Paraphaeosphaeria minitans]|uniref:Uncharacterized protein n=1 Tax=Paraphaeosphaeria minitans TaxID=565426 RepID=A0A9P6GFY7_9PLEO|nr:hypothetical protein PMIN01_06381 [Paraphaeosphaeria minitans]